MSGSPPSTPQAAHAALAALERYQLHLRSSVPGLHCLGHHEGALGAITRSRPLFPFHDQRMDTVHSEVRGNRLLALLDDDDSLRALAPRLVPVPLARHEDLYLEQAPVTHAWFPTAGVLSMRGAAACRCYGFVRTEYARMLSPPA